MRERLALILAALSTAIVFALAAAFSFLHNATHNTPGSVAPRQTPGLVAGRAVYDGLGCGGCHSIGGQGNPRNPLDDVGARRSPDDLRDWIVASDSVLPRLSPSVARIKQSYRDLSALELEALVEYLASLQTTAEPR